MSNSSNGKKLNATHSSCKNLHDSIEQVGKSFLDRHKAVQVVRMVMGSGPCDDYINLAPLRRAYRIELGKETLKRISNLATTSVSDEELCLTAVAKLRDVPLWWFKYPHPEEDS